MMMIMWWWCITLTQVVDIVAGLVQCSGIELESNDGEDDDRKEEEEGDVHLSMMIMTISMMTAMTLTRMKVLFTRGPIALAMDDITTWRPEIERCNEDGFFPHLHFQITITIIYRKKCELANVQICTNAMAGNHSASKVFLLGIGQYEKYENLTWQIWIAQYEKYENLTWHPRDKLQGPQNSEGPA